MEKSSCLKCLILLEIAAINAFGLKDHDLNSLESKFGHYYVLHLCVGERESVCVCRFVN